MAGVHQWRGYDVHGFDGPEALAYSMDNAGHRHAHNFEVCAKLMNGGLYATNNPPPDAEDHKEFEHLIVSDPVYGQMAMDGGVDHRGWIGYKPTVGLRTRELPVGSLKINHQISLPCREINGGSKFRRHVVLPPSLLQPGDVIYHFLEYKTLPNMEFRERASALAHRAAAAAAAAAADGEGGAGGDDAQDGEGGAGGDAAQDGEGGAGGDDAQDGEGGAGGDDAQDGDTRDATRVSSAQEGDAEAHGYSPPDWMEIPDNYHSSSDEDYEPDEADNVENHVMRVNCLGTLDD